MSDQTVFEENLARLEEIISQLEKGDVSLGDSLKLFDEGVQLIRLCSQKLDTAEARIAELVANGQGEVKIVPLDLKKENKGV